MFKTEQFNTLQDGFKKHISKFNVNSRKTYAYASGHFLFFCEKLGCTEVYRLQDMLDYWHESLTKGVSTYKKHVRNHFVPYLISVYLSLPVSQPMPIQEKDDSYTNNEDEPPRKKRRIGDLHINIDLCEKKRKRPIREKIAIRRVMFEENIREQNPIPPNKRCDIGRRPMPRPRPTKQEEVKVEVEEDIPQMEEYDDSLSKICVVSMLFLMYSVVASM